VPSRTAPWLPLLSTEQTSQLASDTLFPYPNTTSRAYTQPEPQIESKGKKIRMRFAI
jgi:hypothetical protein